MEMVQVQCIVCGKSLTVPKKLEKSPFVCNQACYDDLWQVVYDVEFCIKYEWAVVESGVDETIRKNNP